MRLDQDTDTDTEPILVLSERNLLVLLSKLYTEDSACEIGGGEQCPMSVRVETDEAHYSEREFGPGPMHPTTERIVRAVRAATVGETIEPLEAFFIMPGNRERPSPQTHDDPDIDPRSDCDEP